MRVYFETDTNQERVCGVLNDDIFDLTKEHIVTFVPETGDDHMSLREFVMKSVRDEIDEEDTVSEAPKQPEKVEMHIIYKYVPLFNGDKS